MASTQPSTTSLSPEQRKFQEAYNLHMPPYDFKVWDQYLFSRCSNGEQVLGLLNMFKWLMTSGDYNVNADGIEQFCTRGDLFVKAVKDLIDMAEPNWPNKAEISRDLQFIEKHQAIFKDGPMQLSAVGKKEQDAWRDQAKACILSKSPHDATLRVIYPLPWFAKQEAYFAFGVLAWNIQQDPGWANEDTRLDVWYKLGFSIATRQQAADELHSQYKKYFSFKHFEFEKFLDHWSSGTLAKQLQVGLKSENSIFWIHLSEFYAKQTTKDGETVFRLYQVVSLNNDAYRNLMKTRDWGIFENARKNYKLDGFPDREDRAEEKRKAITRKLVFHWVLRNIKHPMNLHLEMIRGQLREFITNTYKEHSMQLSEETLNIACCDY